MERIDVKVLPKLFQAIQAAADEKGVSPGRWLGQLAAESLGVSEPDGLPELGKPGRPRKDTVAAK